MIEFESRDSTILESSTSASQSVLKTEMRVRKGAGDRHLNSPLSMFFDLLIDLLIDGKGKKKASKNASVTQWNRVSPF